MSIVRLLALGFLLFAGCRKPATPPPSESQDFELWQVVGANPGDVEMRIGSVPISLTQCDFIIKHFVETYPSMSIRLLQEKGVPVDMALPILRLAEKHGVTNFTVRIRQENPPPVKVLDYIE